MKRHFSFLLPLLLLPVYSLPFYFIDWQGYDLYPIIPNTNILAGKQYSHFTIFGLDIVGGEAEVSIYDARLVTINYASAAPQYLYLYSFDKIIIVSVTPFPTQTSYYEATLPTIRGYDTYTPVITPLPAGQYIITPITIDSPNLFFALCDYNVQLCDIYYFSINETNIQSGGLTWLFPGRNDYETLVTGKLLYEIYGWYTNRTTFEYLVEFQPYNNPYIKLVKYNLTSYRLAWAVHTTDDYYIIGFTNIFNLTPGILIIDSNLTPVKAFYIQDSYSGADFMWVQKEVVYYPKNNTIYAILYDFSTSKPVVVILKYDPDTKDIYFLGEIYSTANIFDITYTEAPYQSGNIIKYIDALVLNGDGIAVVPFDVIPYLNLTFQHGGYQYVYRYEPNCISHCFTKQPIDVGITYYKVIRPQTEFQQISVSSIQLPPIDVVSPQVLVFEISTTKPLQYKRYTYDVVYSPSFVIIHLPKNENIVKIQGETPDGKIITISKSNIIYYTDNILLLKVTVPVKKIYLYTAK